MNWNDYCQMIYRTSIADKKWLFILDVYSCFLLGTRIGQASECFVYWKDPATSDTWVIFQHFYFSTVYLSTCLLVFLSVSTCLLERSSNLGHLGDFSAFLFIMIVFPGYIFISLYCCQYRTRNMKFWPQPK